MSTAEEINEEDLEGREDPAYAYTGSKWTDVVGSGPIPVCWVNPDSVNGEGLSAAEGVLKSQFHDRTAVRFTFSGECTSSDARRTMIRARFDTSDTWASSNGWRADGGRSWVGPSARSLGGESMATLKSGFPRTWGGPQDFKNFVLRTLLHEFGHAVGLHHEHERRDASNCDEGDVGVGNSNSVTIGSYDPQSVMNYCATNEAPVFTSTDIQGINYLFPGDASDGGDTPTTPPSDTPTLGSISPSSVRVGASAKTLTVNGANFSENTRILVNNTKLYPATVSSQQITTRLSSSWFTSARTLTIRVYNKSSSGRKYANGSARIYVAN